MHIIDLTEEHRDLYFVCLEDWSDEMKEAGERKARWYERVKDRGLRVKLAVDDRGEVGGMIHYLPAEHSFVAGRDLYVIHCIWVHGYEQGRGNFRKQGMGRALIEAAEEDARSLGAKGIAAWGLAIPVWMRASWFKKRGFRKVDRIGLMSLLFKAFDDAAEPPRWIRPARKVEVDRDRVTVTCFVNGWCPAGNIVYERTRRAAATFGDRVLLREYDTADKQTLTEWGQSDAIFIDGRPLRTGPPPSYEHIEKAIAKRVNKRFGRG